MTTRSLLVFAILAGAPFAQTAQAQAVSQIDRVGSRSVEIITASAGDSAQGLRVSGLVRRGKGLGRPPVTAHLDITAFDAEGLRLTTLPARIGLLTATRGHREPGRYTAVFPLLAARNVARLEVRYQARPHAAETEGAPQ